MLTVNLEWKLNLSVPLAQLQKSVIDVVPFRRCKLHSGGESMYIMYCRLCFPVWFPEEGRHNSTTRLALLQESNWLDEKTLAVIIELTMFNSDANLFCSISVVFELSYFGIIRPTLSVHSFSVPIFHQQTKGQQLFFLAAVAFLLVYIADGLYSVVQGKKYTKNISRTISFILKSAFFLLVPFQVFKFKMGADIVHFFLLYPNNFIPFHAVSHLDQNLRNTLGFLAFLAVLKTLKYSQLFCEMRLAQRSILAAISSMAFVVVVYFFIFMAFGYLVFGSVFWSVERPKEVTPIFATMCPTGRLRGEFSDFWASRKEK